MPRRRLGPQETQGADETSDSWTIDFISGTRVLATPEEVDAVQVFARRLVKDYGYRKAQIQTRPQHRVRHHPSDRAKTYPVDIAVFSSPQKTAGNLVMIVECKQPNRRDGEDQLRLYMDMSSAEIGVWFNGNAHLYLRKVIHKDGRRTYQTLPNIPRAGQRIEDIGLYLRKDLVPPSNLKAIFRDIRNHLAGMTTGITRDETLAQEIINILFCKLLDETETEPDKMLKFRSGVDEETSQVQERIEELFDQVKQTTFGEVFESTDQINLDPQSLAYVVGELQPYAIADADRYAIGDAFEIFIGPALRGAEGQFFTPRNVIEMMVALTDPRPGERVIDPACGSGGFLITALTDVWTKLRREAKRKGWKPEQLTRKEVELATNCFWGIDKDAFLARVSKAYMALIGDGRGSVFCHNSLEAFDDWPAGMRNVIEPGTFDVVLTNPPFGKKIVVQGERTIAQFELGSRWNYDAESAAWNRTDKLREQVPPQILFLERCIQLLKPGGRLGIVLPESLFGNPSHGYVIEWLRARVRVDAVVSMPEALFKTSGKGGTHTRVCILLATLQSTTKKDAIFLAEAQWCGHDSRGNPTKRKGSDGKTQRLDDIPEITKRMKASRRQRSKLEPDPLGFLLPHEEISRNVLIPRYYNPEIPREMERLAADYELTPLGDLVNENKLSFQTGVEVGKMAYGTGDVPFIRTSDIANWEIKRDFKHGVSEQTYRQFKKKAPIKSGDILLVKDGTYLIGTCGIVT